MDSQFSAAQSLGAQKYSRKSTKILQYGTAGFREKSFLLPHVMYRLGLLAVLRSKFKSGSTVGLMITASHNPEEDNGVKLFDPDSKMLEEKWEVLATDLINANDESVKDVLKYIVDSEKIDFDSPSFVFLARDTRSSSEGFLLAAIDGVESLKGSFKNFGLLTTPQLHFVVYCKNFGDYGTPTVEGYYEKLSNAFDALRSISKVVKRKYVNEIHIDGANGIGALKFNELQMYIKTLTASIYNNGMGKLNFQCGADFVKVEQKPPKGSRLKDYDRHASFDGDADRLVYFYIDAYSVFHLLDGDKIATLVAKYLKDLVDLLSLNIEIRVVQTAYANGRSTQYIENELKIPVICVPTGVKHLHHEAMKYDIGIYFEANGHGTVVFSQKIKEAIQDVINTENCDQMRKKEAAFKLLSVIDLINETVGDAISDLLLVEVILHDLDWSVADWDKMYTDLPNRQLKVKIPDRTAITTMDAERVCVKPDGLQKAISSVVLTFKEARSFVRPSGTEDIVRVYAEAHTQADADNLADAVKKLVEEFTQSAECSGES